MFPLHPFPISCPPITSNLHTEHPFLPHPPPHHTMPPFSCSPPHIPSTQQCPPLYPHPYPTPPLVYHIPSINSPPSPTLLSGEVTWMMLCSSSELIQLHLTLSPCKTNQCTSWVNQSLSENPICRLDIKSYTCRSNPKINARK